MSAWLIASLSRGRHYDDAAALTADLCERFFGNALVRIATGRFLLDQYRFEEALPYFREAFTLDSEDPRALRWLLYGLRRARRFDEVEALAAMTELAGMPQIEYARSQLDRYQFECVLAGLSEVTDERMEVPALQTRLEALRSLHRLDEAQRLTEENLDRRPENPRLWIELGWVFGDRHRLEEALAAFNKALTVDPTDAEALEWRTTALRRMHGWREAEQAAQEAIARRPEVPELYLELGYLHQDQHDYGRALGAFEQALAIDPKHETALEWRVTELRRLRDFDHAEQATCEAITQRPDSLALRLQLGYLYDDQHDYERALGAFEQALAIDPKHEWALVWRVTELRRLRDFDQAEQAAHEAITQRPDTPNLRIELGYLYDELYDYERALGAFEQALAIDPKHETALEWRVTELRRLRRFDQAEQAAHEAITQRPDTPNLRIELGYLYDELYDYERALGAFEQALAIDPKHEWALVWRVTELRRLRRFDQAEQATCEAISQRPDSLALRLQLGYLHQEQHDYERALGAFEQALAIDPKHEWALVGRITELRQLRRFDQAEQAAHEAITQRPDSLALHLRLGYLYDELYDYERALGAFEQALAIDPKHETALEWRITELRRLRRFDQAEQAAHEAITQRPDTPNLRIELGYLYDELYDYQQALGAFEQALAIDPKHEWALVWRVTELRRLRRFDQAEQATCEAISQRPDSLALRLELGYLYDDQHDYERALGAFEQALAIDPKHEWALVGRITELRQLRRFDQAEQAAHEAITQRPDSLALHLRLGYLYDDQHDYERALGAFEQALAIDPKHEWALAWRITELRQLRRFDQAEQATREAITQRPDSLALRLELANIAEDTGNWSDALTAVHDALALDTSNESALTAQIRVMRVSRDLVGALAAAQRAVDVRPDSVEVLVELAQLHAARFEDRRALEVLDRALAIDPGHAQVVERRVAALQRLQRHLDAEQCARVAIMLRPTAESLHISLGQVFEDRIQPREALACYEAAARCNPRDPRALIGQSAALRALRSYTEAERLIAPVVREQPHLRALTVELAWIQHDSGRLPESRASFARLEREALSDDERAESIAGLGWVDFACGDYTAAEEHFGRAIALMPKDREYRLARAWALVRHDERAQWEEAEQMCLELLDEQQDAAVLVCAGVIDYRLGRLPAAEYHLAKALDVDPYRGSHTDLAALYTQLGRYEEAEAHLRIAITQDPYNAAAQVELGHLHLLTKAPQEAARKFRTVLRVDPSIQVAALGLAEALATLGQPREAEDVLREGLRTAATPWRLHLALARLLFHQADATQNDDVFAEAYAEAIEAIKEAPANEPDPYYVAAVCKVRLGATTTAGALGDAHSRRQALRHLNRCLSIEEGHVDAQRVVQLLDRENRAARTAALGTATVATVALGLLAVMWTAFFLSSRVTVVMITTITPILVGLVAVAVLLPSLIRLKLPGFEADLQAGLGQITSGPTGEVVIRPGNLAISTGPVGHAPNHRRSEDRHRR